MSELIQKNDNHTGIRWKLLTGVSALVLTVHISFANAAEADDAGRPTVWIELGGQLERIDNAQEAFAPPFFSLAASNVLAPMVDAQRSPLYSFGENGKITFQPSHSDWLFSASLRYGRASRARHFHYETNHPTVIQTLFGVQAAALVEHAFGDGQGSSHESHLVVDFQAGKDIGLGFLGRRGTSVLSAGVRFAQFGSDTDVTLHGRPVYESGPFFTIPGFAKIHDKTFQDNNSIIQSKRNAHAVGPSVAWDASLPFAGNGSNSELTFDWGVNGAILFGRQRARTHHQTSGYNYSNTGFGPYFAVKHSYLNPPVDHASSRTVTIPNIGGFAGISFRYANAKVSFGYRGDFFFNAMDNGWDTSKSSTLGFYGPFATIGIGLGG